VTATRADGPGDLRLGAHRVDRDDGAVQVEFLQQQRDGGDLVGFLLARLLAQHQSLAGRPGGDQMQRLASLAAVMGAPRGLAVDRDELRQRGVTEFLDAGEEAGFEQLRIDGGKHVAQRVMAGDAIRVGQEAAEEWQWRSPHSVVSTKSSAPAIVAASASKRISGNGYRTLALCRGPSMREKWRRIAG